MNTPPSKLSLPTSRGRDSSGPPAVAAATQVSCGHVFDRRCLLDDTLDRLRSGKLEDAVWRLAVGLRTIRAASSPDEWKVTVSECLAHPVRELLHQEPYTRRSFRQPRGYPGDAGMIDYLYLRGPAPDEQVTDLGLALHQVAIRTPSGYGVRFRRDLAARLIDQTAARTALPSVLSVACGHLREAERSSAVLERRLGRFVAIDQDEESAKVVSKEWGSYGVEARCQSAAELIRAGASVGRFDLVYALGLYDYLAIGPARMLTRHLFDFVAPGGSLVVANFVPGNLEAGYMEAFMRWNLVYRTPDELRAVCELLPAGEVAGADVWTEDAGGIAYLTVKRR
jgi:extracellular factor (EF) 3-hydroxypalmitic acid methyl ester biosynthesis protein